MSTGLERRDENSERREKNERRLLAVYALVRNRRATNANPVPSINKEAGSGTGASAQCRRSYTRSRQQISSHRNRQGRRRHYSASTKYVAHACEAILVLLGISVVVGAVGAMVRKGWSGLSAQQRLSRER